MPNSLRNSRVEEKLQLVDVLTPVQSSNSGVNNIFSISSSKPLQRSSECEPTSFGKQLVKLQQSSPRPYFDEFLNKESPIKLEGFPCDDNSNKT